MHMISTVRTLLADPRRRLAGVLLIVTLILGVVTMHAMSGSSTAHALPAPVTVSTDQHAAADAPAGAVPVQTPGDHDTGTCAGDCGHHAMTAMCLMTMVALLTLAVPALRARFLIEAVERLLRALRPVPGHHRAAPDLDALGISRT